MEAQTGPGGREGKVLLQYSLTTIRMNFGDDSRLKKVRWFMPGLGKGFDRIDGLSHVLHYPGLGQALSDWGSINIVD